MNPNRPRITENLSLSFRRTAALIVSVFFFFLTAAQAQTPTGQMDSTVCVTPGGDTVVYYQIRGVEFGRNIVTPQQKYHPLSKDEKEQLHRQQRHAHRKAVEQRMATLRKGRENNPPRSITYAVGEIQLASGVSPSGARTYQIPIQTAPGVRFAPSISLVYNSQGRDGVAGYGWDLAGVSSISLINQNIYYHGQAKAAGIHNTTDPVFALDGVPIVQNDDPATAQQYPFATARGHILVRQELNSLGYVKSFTALFPNGNTGIFGAVVDNPVSNYPVYPMVHLENLQKDSIVFHYSYGGTYFGRTLLNVEYAHDHTGYPQAKIIFSHSSSTDYPVQYYAGTKISRSDCISSIESKNGLDVIRHFDLTHEVHDNVRLLTRVDCSSGGEQLTPLCFSYEAQSLMPEDPDTLRSGSSMTILSAYSGDPIFTKRGKMIQGRFNDGIVSYPDLSTYDAIHITGIFNKKRKYGSPYPTDQPILVAAKLQDFGFVDNSILSGTGFQTVEPIDVDGDGSDEIVRVNFGESSSSGSPLLLSVYKCNAAGQTSLQYLFSVTLQGVLTEGSFNSPYRRQYFWGDFNGDGKAELLTIAHDKNSHDKTQVCYAALIDIDSHTLLSEDVLFNFTYEEGTAGKVFTFDVDGDSKTELCHATASGLDVYRLGTSNHFSLSRTLSDMSLSNLRQPFFATDLNGDGYLDVLKTPASLSSTWTVYSFDGESVQTNYSYLSTYDDTARYLFIDVNRDGLTDFTRACGTDVSLYLNTDGFLFEAARTSSGIISDASGIAVANVLDPSGMSAFIKIDGLQLREYFYPAQSSELRAVCLSEDSQSRITNNYYTYLPSKSNEWADSISVNNAAGYALRPLPIQVLSEELSFQSLYSSDAYNWMDYSYYDPIVHNLGLGFCGFAHIRSYDNLDDPITRITDVVYDPQKMGVVTEERHSLGGSASPWATTAYTYDNHSTTYGKLAPRLTRAVSSDSRSGISTDTNYGSYDAYDFPVLIRTDRYLAPNLISNYEILQRTYSHSASTSKYILGTIVEEILTRERDGNTASSWKERDSTAYDTLMRPISRKHFVGLNADSLVSETRWTYDTHGNVTSEKKAPYGATTFTGDTLVYDNGGRFLVSKTDALGRTTTFANYDKFGNPASSTDHKARTTAYTYDAWGHLVSTTRPDGTIEQSSRAWGGSGLYIVSRTTTGAPETITHYDALGREVRSGVKRFNGQWQYIDKEYDARGRLHRVSLPYRGNAPSLWNVYVYDHYDRPTGITEASGKISTWSYSGTSTTTVRDSIAVTSTTDAFGDIVQVVDAGGTILLTLRDDAQPSSVTAPGGITTSFTYDGYGRCTAIIDHSAGTRTEQWTWSADGSSTVVSTHPNGSVTTHADRFGRTTLVERSGAYSTAYTYDNDGLLLSMVSSNKADRFFTYDALDRISTVTDSVGIAFGGRWIRKIYTYGSGSVVASIKYTSPDGDITTESYTYTNGHNTSITLPDNTPVWSLVSENDLGMPTQILSGSVTREYGYTTAGLPTYRKMGNPSNGGLGSLQHFTYQFHALTGNLISRADVNHNQAETFTYDALDRLSSINGRTISYDNATGNITAIGDVGTLSYTNSLHPYQITGLSPVADSLISFGLQTATYTSFDRPATLEEGLFSALFKYGSNGERVMTTITETDGVFESWYAIDRIGDRYECTRYGSIEPTREILYLGGDAYAAPMVYVKQGSGNWTLYNIGRDYLGSITQIATADGTMVAEYSYDPWGRLRDPQTLAIYARGNEPTLFLDRGFTGHEHLKQFGLINMNARLYDPLVGRFLSPDPYIQDPGFSQGFNRYSYALNNPLKYTDQSGEYALIDDVFAALIGGFINWGLNGFKSGHGQGALYFAIGALGGLGTLYASQAETAIIGVVSGLNSVVTQGYSSGSWNPESIDPMKVISDACLGAATSYVGGQLSSWLSNTPLLSWTSKVESGALSHALNRGLSNGLSGLVLGTGMGMIATEGDWDQSLQLGLYSGLMGLSFGALSGFVEGSLSDRTTPWSKDASDSAISQDEMVTASDLHLENEVSRIKHNQTYPHFRHDGTTYYNKGGELPVGPTYREYVVPPMTGKGPGAWRIVVSSDNQWFFSPDHYHSFLRFLP